MSEEIKGVVGGWHELGPDDVYLIACQEYETRQAFGQLITEVHFDAPEPLSAAQKLRDDFESYASSWLEAQIALRGSRSVVEASEDRREITASYIRNLREEAGLSQRGLAAILPGVSQATISRAEKGEVPRRTLYDLYYQMVIAIEESRER